MRFYSEKRRVEFYDPDPLTEEDEAEAKLLWQMMTKGAIFQVNRKINTDKKVIK
ncbi:MAG TPA: hypothetical protein VFM18_23200 [Methanosarcina sp.]|nr:hypothetical protein [Methanosarcina sp.]